MEDNAIVEALRKVARRIVDNELQLMTLRSLMKTKGHITEQEWQHALKTAYETHTQFERFGDLSPAQALEELLRDLEGPKQ